MLSPEVEKRLLAAQKAEKTYRPNDEICAKLREKTLVMLVGPAAIGKSFLMNHLVEIDEDFGRVPVFTTRDPRPDDEPGMFRCVPHDDEHVGALLDKIEAREVVQYAVHPTSGRIYGSMLDDFSHEFNLLATLSDVVDHLSQQPFKNTVVIGLAAKPEIWQKRFNERYPTQTGEREKRLKEAVKSLNWLLDSTTVKWVDNTAGEPRDTVQSVVNIVKYNNQENPGTREDARRMRDTVLRSL